MSRSSLRRPLALLAALALGLTAAACSDDDSSSTATTAPAGLSTDGTGADSDADGSTDADGEIDGSEIFTPDGVKMPDGIAREHIAIGIKAALSADRVDYADGEFRVYLSEGSKDDPVVIGCIAVAALLEEGETATLIFPDGELDCSN